VLFVGDGRERCWKKERNSARGMDKSKVLTGFKITAPKSKGRK
jgi:hypothetical protein